MWIWYSNISMWIWNVAVSFLLVLVFNSSLSQSLSIGLDYDDEDARPDPWGRCAWIRNKLKNGRVKIRSRGRIAKFSCKSGYDLVGRRFATCVRGQWNNPIPVCISKGCPRMPAPINGEVTELNSGAALSFDCSPGYSLVGDSILYCDGSEWDKEPPKCQVTILEPPIVCDFEDPDICGWTHDPTHHFDWKRHQFATPSGHVGTGPSYDHTYGEGKAGYYMYEEASAPRNENDTSRLFSPVYPFRYSPGCFTFWYHMYGATIGRLRIYIKPESSILAELTPSWEEVGDQGNQWLRGNVTVPLLSENFQIVIEGIRGSSYVGDTAIDDIAVVNADCNSLGDSNSTESVEATENSCRGRCHEIDNSTSCGCTSDCESNSTCCSDYLKLCAEKNETASREEDPGDHRPMTVMPETGAESETTEAEMVGTPLTATPMKLYTEAETNSTFPTNTTTENPQKQPTAVSIPTISKSPLTTGVITQSTDRRLTAMTNAPETIGTTAIFTALTEVLPVTRTGNQSSNATSPVSIHRTSVEPVTTPSSNNTTTVRSRVPNTTARMSTTTATTLTVEILPVTIETSINGTPVVVNVTTSHVSSSVPTIAPKTVKLTTTASSTPTAEAAAVTFSSAKSFLPPSITNPVTRSAPTTVTKVSEMQTSEKLQSTKATTAISAPETSTYNNGRSWSASTSVKVVSSTLRTVRPLLPITTSAIIPRRTTEDLIPTLGKLSTTTEAPRIPFFTKVRTVKTTTTKQGPSFYTTESQPPQDNSNRIAASVTEVKTDTPKNHSSRVVGICIGAIIVAGLVCGAAYVYLRRRQKRNRRNDDSEIRYLPDNEVVEYSDSTALDHLL